MVKLCFNYKGYVLACPLGDEEMEAQREWRVILYKGPKCEKVGRKASRQDCICRPPRPASTCPQTSQLPADFLYIVFTQWNSRLDMFKF